MEPKNDPLLPFISGAGNGFLLGHGIALFESLYHSFNNAPSGYKFRDFVTRLPRSCYDSSVQIATWSIVSCIVDPVIAPYFEPGFFRNLASGAATGALLEIRCGVPGMLSGAYSGAMQSLSMSLFHKTVGLAAGPIHSYVENKRKEGFVKKRANSVFGDPLQVLTKAFL